jgi:hypothetical protein
MRLLHAAALVVTVTALGCGRDSGSTTSLPKGGGHNSANGQSCAIVIAVDSHQITAPDKVSCAPSADILFVFVNYDRTATRSVSVSKTMLDRGNGNDPKDVLDNDVGAEVEAGHSAQYVQVHGEVARPERPRPRNRNHDVADTGAAERG